MLPLQAAIPLPLGPYPPLWPTGTRSSFTAVILRSYLAISRSGVVGCFRNPYRCGVAPKASFAEPGDGRAFLRR